MEYEDEELSKELEGLCEYLERGFNIQLNLLRKLMETADDKAECIKIIEDFINQRKF